MSMLVWQAAAAHEIWYGAQFSTKDIELLCDDAVFEMKTFGNLVLCGFMGSGKTTVGAQLAKLTGRSFVDLDRLIEQNAGLTVPDIFRSKRRSGISAAGKGCCNNMQPKSDLVVATGGGTLIDPASTAVLRENGVIILLDAGLNVIRERLKYDHSRPLLAGPNGNEAMERLYKERIPIYRNAADFIIPAEEHAERVAKNTRDIKNRLSEKDKRESLQV